MNIDLYILTFSAITVAATIWMGFRSAKKSKTASDFFVAGRSVSVGWNASAISGEYLSAASFMGIAGMVMSSGYDALWYPVCYACGYLFLLLFIAGPLRRFGAYTIPDFAEGRFDSPVFRKIAVVFVLFIGFFYTMPQMKGAGTTLAYIFPGLPYWAGVVLVGAVITLNVALGGMKGITLVQAFQYWAKMFAISVPIFVLMAVYGHYGKQVGVNHLQEIGTRQLVFHFHTMESEHFPNTGAPRPPMTLPRLIADVRTKADNLLHPNRRPTGVLPARSIIYNQVDANRLLELYQILSGRTILKPDSPQMGYPKLSYTNTVALTVTQALAEVEAVFATINWGFVPVGEYVTIVVPQSLTNEVAQFARAQGVGFQPVRVPLPIKAPTDATWLNPFGPLTTKAAKTAAAAIGKKEMSREAAKAAKGNTFSNSDFANFASSRDSISLRTGLAPDQRMTVNLDSPTITQALGVYAELTGRQLVPNTNSLPERVDDLLGGKLSQLKIISRAPAPDTGVREHGDGALTAAEVKAAIEAHLRTNGVVAVAIGNTGLKLIRMDVPRSSEGGEASSKNPSLTSPLRGTISDSAAVVAEKAWLDKHEKPLALLYTYSLIIAIVCGTAGLPHILVRFYTNPDGAAAKRTTMWVMILIGVFYVFPPVFGALGRNILPDLYNGVGAKGTDKIVLELPRILNAKYPPLGSILSGITCAGAFAAFMSTFSGLLVSMTGALAHDVYGRILRPKSTPEERMRMFKWCAVLLGGVAILLGSMVEPLEINFMVGQAFAIAAASYFPLLFMAVWWRKLTMKGAAIGMLTGGLAALFAVALTNGSNLALDKGPMGKVFAAFAPLNGYWAEHPLLRILCEQPAIWAVPLAITLMIVVSKLTAREVPGDIRMKMLVLHAPEQLGLKQEYIQEHQAH